MTMMNLVNQSTGFRLQRLEIYNWGTFDKVIWTMTPECQTAVLTGANGSGKSTVVDALLTLLVETRQRNYNLASGAGNPRERNERTYVRGQYSRSRGESAIEARANMLRDAHSHSVLLGVFYDPAEDRTVALAQILWISSSDRVEKRYYVASQDLTIEEHFPQRNINAKTLPKAVDSYKNFKDYIAAARKALGLSGKPKALDLFNETVAIKDIASLNTFVRNHMLDKGEPEARVDTLRSQYRDLNEAHAAIQRASHQIRILEPLIKAGQEYRRYDEQIAQYTQAKELVPFYVAEQAHKILNDALQTTENLRQAEQSKLENVDRRLKDRRTALEEIQIAIAQDSTGQIKREIEGRIELIKRQITPLKKTAERYDGHAQVLGLPTYQDEDRFYHNREQAEQQHTATQQQIKNLDRERSNLNTELRDLISKGNELDKEIKYLEAHPSNIPPHVARIREHICTALNIALEDLPFVGELLQVQPEETQWEGALERLLNSFAKDLIVAEAHYAPVSRYINQQHLGGRLVYQRVDPDQRERLPEARGVHVAGAMAYDKLQIVEATPYHDWLASTLMRKFAYLCCEDLADFHQAERALTPQGQIKHNARRHEKDDRSAIHDRRNFVLGWDNREKRRQLENERDSLGLQIIKYKEQLQALEHKLERARNQIRSFENILEIRSFQEIDWRTPQAEYDQLQRRLAELNQQSQQLLQLEQQRTQLQHEVSEIEGERDEINGEIRSLTDTIKSYQKLLHIHQQQLANVSERIQQLRQQLAAVLEAIDKEPINIETLGIRTQTLETSINRSIGQFGTSKTRFESVILDAMNTFRREYPDAGVSLTSTIESLADFERIYHQLENDELPQYEQRFKQMLDRTVSRGVQVFASYLSEQERAIDRSVAELNQSLAQVDYGGGSIIQLIAERTNDAEINDFQRDLRACIPNAGDHSPEELERAYNQIKALIARFDEDPNWMRRVIDVRRWRIFAAEQLDSQRQQVDYYSDSSGKSGGQKAKLAYTILASAIAYQYGLQDSLPNDRSFRFVVIDEAFSKLDDDNARYAMKLFEQLGLQLLVVTPMQQLHVIEQFVHAYHVVVNNTEGSYSRMFNLTQHEYHQRRREFQAQEQQV